MSHSYRAPYYYTKYLIAVHVADSDIAKLVLDKKAAPNWFGSIDHRGNLNERKYTFNTTDNKRPESKSASNDPISWPDKDRNAIMHSHRSKIVAL